MRSTAPPQPDGSLVRESFDEAAFLWARWEQVLDSPLHTLDDVERWVEERLLGALDGVRLGGPEAVQRLLAPALGGRRARAAKVAAFVLPSFGRAGLDLLVESMERLDYDRLLPIRHGLEHAVDPGGSTVLVQRLRGLPPPAQAIVLETLAFRGETVDSHAVDHNVDRTSPLVQRALLRLAGARPHPWSEALVVWGSRRSDPELRIEAARSGMQLGLPAAVGLACEAIASTPRAASLLPWVACIGGERALAWIERAIDRTDHLRDAFDALSIVGTVAAADICAAALDDSARAKFAAEALATITGIDPRRERNDPEPDDRAARGSDALLSTPCPSSVRAAWASLRPRLAPRERYFAGAPLSPTALPTLLRTAPTRRRHILALELILRTKGSAVLNTRTWTAVQRVQSSRLLVAARDLGAHPRAAFAAHAGR